MIMNELLRMLRMLRMMRMTLLRKGCSKAALVKAHTRASAALNGITKKVVHCAKRILDLLCCFISLELDAKDYRVLNEKSTPRSKCKQTSSYFSELCATHLCRSLFQTLTSKV